MICKVYIERVHKIEVMKIGNLRVWNFRSIGSDNERPGIDIPLKPLTIFVGPNGSGKSSILYSILWMKLKEGPLYNPISINEKKFFGLQSYEDLAFGRNFTNWMGVEPTFSIDVTGEIKRVLEEINWEMLGIRKPEGGELTYGFKIRKNAEGQIDWRVNFRFGDLKLTVQNAYELVKGYTWLLATPFAEKAMGAGRLRYLVLRDFYIESRLKDCGLERKLGEAKMGEVRKIDRLVRLLLERLKNEFDEKLMFIGARRGYVKFSDVPEASQDVGYEGENMLKAMAYAYLNADLVIKRELTELLTGWAEKFGVKSLNAGLKENELLAVYMDVGMLNLASASYGQKQLITFLTQLVVSPRGSVVMIEEPEISLHPESQAILPLLFADIIKKHNKQIIVTTHSTILPLTISDAVSGEGLSGIRIEETLDVDDIALYHVTRDGNSTRVEEIELTEEGYPRYIPSFAKVEAELFERMSERVMK